MQTENIDQGDQCDYCPSPATFKVTNASKSDWSISCEIHKKDALESLEDAS